MTGFQDRTLPMKNVLDSCGFGLILAEWRKEFKDKGVVINNRVAQNYVKLYTFFEIFLTKDLFQFPFNLEKVREQFIKDLDDSNRLVSQSDGISQF